jgi:hypothetical protein
LVLIIAFKVTVTSTAANGISISCVLICCWANYKRWHLAQPNDPSSPAAAGDEVERKGGRP